MQNLLTANRTAAAPCHKPGSRRVLFSLNDQEMDAFFPGTRWPGGGEPGQEWIFFRGETEAAWREALADFQPDALVSCWSTRALDPAWIAEPDCGLRYVCHVAGSVRHVVPREFLERGGLVTNWGGAASPQVAEHALLLALAALRNAGRWEEHVEAGGRPGIHQTSALQTRSLFGRRVGIHGFGRIARALLPLLRPFHLSISCHSAGVPETALLAEGVTPCADLRELFARSEVLFECEALTPCTLGLVTEEILCELPRDAVFVNVGRGRVVDEPALLRLAAQGRLRIALDVVTEEPLAPDSPARKVPGAILSPHIGGPTADIFPQCGERALQNLRKFLSGQNPEEAMTLEEYERST
jgi:phosphoglycerate dehydrogenase-like enzyme